MCRPGDLSASCRGICVCVYCLASAWAYPLPQQRRVEVGESAAPAARRGGPAAARAGSQTAAGRRGPPPQTRLPPAQQTAQRVARHSTPPLLPVPPAAAYEKVILHKLPKGSEFPCRFPLRAGRDEKSWVSVGGCRYRHEASIITWATGGSPQAQSPGRTRPCQTPGAGPAAAAAPAPPRRPQKAHRLKICPTACPRQAHGSSLDNHPRRMEMGCPGGAKLLTFNSHRPCQPDQSCAGQQPAQLCSVYCSMQVSSRTTHAAWTSLSS